jgi:hypothetical protein
LEFLDVQREHKGLLSYNKNHNTNVLKKYACHEYNFRFVQKMGTIFAIEGYKNPKGNTRVQEKENCPPFSSRILT